MITNSLKQDLWVTYLPVASLVIVGLSVFVGKRHVYQQCIMGLN